MATVAARLRPAKCKRPLCAPLGERAAPRVGAAGLLFWRHRRAHLGGRADRHRRRETMRAVVSAPPIGAGIPAPCRAPALLLRLPAATCAAWLPLPCCMHISTRPALLLPHFRRHLRPAPARHRGKRGQPALPLLLACLALGSRLFALLVARALPLRNSQQEGAGGQFLAFASCGAL